MLNFWSTWPLSQATVTNTDAATPLLSICMIVKNEEANLPRVLASIEGLEAEVVVVDTGSTDATVAIASRAGAKVSLFPWIGDFSAARNEAFAQATGTWMLVLDADEALTPELKAGLVQVLSSANAKIGAFRLTVEDVDDQGVVRMRMPSTRIVRSGCGYQYQGRVHEEVESSVLQSGAEIVSTHLTLRHYGYTAHENARKQRSERNRALVEQAHAASPEDPRYWHYLGLEHAVLGDHEEAARWFERVLSLAPQHELAGWSASQLASIHAADRALGEAWRAAFLGQARPCFGRVSALLRLGEVALRDGDGLAALDAASALEGLPDGVAGDHDRRRQCALVIRARAVALTKGPRAGYSILLRAMTSSPNDPNFGDELVKLAERSEPRSRAAVTAVRDSGGAPAVVAASIGSFVREGAWPQAVHAGDTRGVRSEYVAHALFRVGRRDEARAMLVAFGENAAVHRLLLGLETDDRTEVAEALALMPPRAADAAEHVLARTRVPPGLAFWLYGWMDVAAAHRAYDVAARLAASLPGPASRGIATLSMILYEAGEPMKALEQALKAPAEPEALEVIGFVAQERGDMQAAATLLATRARSGDCSVRLVLRGAQALRAVGRGREREIEALIALGRESRPHASALAAPSARFARSA